MTSNIVYKVDTLEEFNSCISFLILSGHGFAPGWELEHYQQCYCHGSHLVSVSATYDYIITWNANAEHMLATQDKKR